MILVELLHYLFFCPHQHFTIEVWVRWIHHRDETKSNLMCLRFHQYPFLEKNKPCRLSCFRLRYYWLSVDKQPASVEVRKADFGKQMTGTLPLNGSYTVCAAGTTASVDGWSQLDWNRVCVSVTLKPLLFYFCHFFSYVKISFFTRFLNCQLNISVKVVEWLCHSWSCEQKDV